MKVACVILLALLLAGCESSTEFGKCIGATDDKDPKLVYKLSLKNLIVGIVFFELIAPPIYVLVEQTFCPVGKKS